MGCVSYTILRMDFIVRGIGLVYGRKQFYPYIWKPLLISAVIFVVLFALGFAALVPWVHKMAGLFGGVIASVAYVVIWAYIGGGLFSAVSMMLSALLWEPLSYQVEQTVFGDAPRMTHPLTTIMLDGAIRFIHAFFVLCSGALLSFVPFLNVVFMGWLTSHDFTSVAYSRRGTFFMHQSIKLIRCKGFLTFALGSGVLMLIPILNMFALPALVAGGTLMVASADGKVPLAKS